MAKVKDKVEKVEAKEVKEEIKQALDSHGSAQVVKDTHGEA